MCDVCYVGHKTLPTDWYVVSSSLLFILYFSFYKAIYAYCRSLVVIIIMIIIIMNMIMMIMMIMVIMVIVTIIIIIIIVVTAVNLIPTSGSDSPLTVPVFVLFRHSPTYAILRLTQFK